MTRPRSPLLKIWGGRDPQPQDWRLCCCRPI